MTSALRNRLSLNAPKKNVRKNGKNLREKNISGENGDGVFFSCGPGSPRTAVNYGRYNINPGCGKSRAATIRRLSLTIRKCRFVLRNHLHRRCGTVDRGSFLRRQQIGGNFSGNALSMAECRRFFHPGRNTKIGRLSACRHPHGHPASGSDTDYFQHILRR